MMRTFLDNTPLDEALTKFLAALQRVGWPPRERTERIPTTEALARVASRTCFARYALPHYSAAAMDGYAVRAADTYGASEERPRRLKLGEEAVEISTGNPIPDDFDSVIMSEQTSRSDDREIEIVAPAAPGQNIRKVGGEISAGEPLVFPGKRLGPQEIGALMAVGRVSIEVYKRPKIALVPTGDELVLPREEQPAPGKVIEFNSAMLSGAATEQGAMVSVLEPVGDERSALVAVIREAVADSDIVVVNAGSSVGPRDHCALAVEEAGDVVVHGVAIRPGKPVVLGIVGLKPVIGLPGYPVSAFLGFDLFVKPLIRAFTGLSGPHEVCIPARLSRRVVSSLGYDEFVMVRVGSFDDGVIAVPLVRGAANIGSLVKAHGFVQIPRLSEGFEAGEEVQVRLLRDGLDHSRVLLTQGVYDRMLDRIFRLAASRLGLGLSYVPSNSMSAVRAIRKSEAHVAAVRLETGWTFEAVRESLEGIPCEVFPFDGASDLAVAMREDSPWSEAFVREIWALVQGGSACEGLAWS